MEKRIAEIPLLKKIKISSKSIAEDSSCCLKPAASPVCCVPAKTEDEYNGACCAQPVEGSACCDK